MKIFFLAINLLLIIKNTFALENFEQTQTKANQQAKTTTNAEDNNLQTKVNTKTSSEGQGTEPGYSDSTSYIPHVQSPAIEDCKHINEWLGYSESFDCCTDVHITCADGHITRVIIENTTLTGPIPPELGNLKYVYDLWLDHNKFTGSIPPEIGEMTSLKDFSVGANELTGTIPPELGKLRNLIKLKFYNNQLTGTIPPELGELTNLQQLYINENQISGQIPTELGNLSSLEELKLNNNKLSGKIPKELGNLSKLQKLYLNKNKFTGTIPSELGNIKGLRELYLDHNYLDVTSIPPEIESLPNKVDFRLHDQQKPTNVTLIIVIIAAIIILLITAASVVFFMKKKNNKTNKNEENKSGKIEIVNNKIDILIQKNDDELQEQKSQIEVNTIQLKKQIESQEQEMKKKLQEIQQMKQRLENFEKNSSISYTNESTPIKKTKEQEALEEKQLQQQKMNLDTTFSYGHSIIPMGSCIPPPSPCNSHYSVYSMSSLAAPVIPPTPGSSYINVEDNPPNYEEIIKEVKNNKVN